ncbi:MAG TPA: tetratricopeptide repeat protein [Pseudomonas xinjiangensis]|uniref:Ancillary SecYEG translocon subunit n=2 Tax=root TaxID=1 RepID=A0A7V1BPL8_9GAMM|nr:tetratricopeptide repeat protein [Halopseudomonas xinjiangensis]HEC48642.1 tetratricopeptide repeat protein [Halopseudomonas xinjiangensis]
MSYQTEEEQVERIKELWRRHGVPLLTGAVLALAGVFGWNAWTDYKQTQAANASALYQTMLEAVLSNETVESRTQAAELAEQLRSDYPGTQYAQFAALMQAKLAVEAEDFAGAEKLLNEVANSADAALGEVARQRLARVLAQQERAEEALELFTTEVTGQLLAGREEIRGDLLLGLGREEEAREAYRSALEAIEDPRARPQLQLKLDDLAEEA